MAEPAALLTAQLLQWIALRPRCYGDVMEAWRTSCPRLPVWELAVEQGLVQIDRPPRTAMADCPVILTPAGSAMLRRGRA